MAKNPYEVLGVSPNASKEDVEKAYRKLIREYHPDQYGDNPLKKLAEEKLQEVNEAYDKIKSNSSYNSYNNTNSSNTYTNNNNNEFTQVRFAIQNGNIAQAEAMLNNITNRNAEWNFLMGMVHSRRNWNDSAYNYFRTACSMDPYNREYSSMLNAMNRQNQQYRNYNTYGNQGCSACDMCQCLVCSDCCCECCGGDLISCC